MKEYSLNEFIKGYISGTIGTIISHPFDTIKTNLQKGQKLNLNQGNFKNNFKNTIKSLYRGILPPLIGVGIEKSIVFGTYHSSYYWLKGNPYYKFSDNGSIAIAGGFAGFCTSFVVTPVDRLKIIAQTNENFKLNNFDFKNLRTIQSFGNLQNLRTFFQSLYKGFSLTIIREVPGFAIYFSIYHQLKQRNVNENNVLPLYKAFLFGGASGVISWAFIYPQDTVKTYIQSSKYSSHNLINNSSRFEKINNREAKNLKEIVLKIYNIENVQTFKLLNFYKGFHFALLRAIPLHCVTFMTYEYLNRYL